MKLGDRGVSTRASINWMLVAVTVLALGVMVPSSIAFLMTTAAIYGILALSLNPILGGVGMLSMCQLTFAAVGAGVMGALNGRVPFLLGVLLAAASAVPVGLLVGAIALRLRGVSFAAASLGLATVGQIVLSQNALPGFQSDSSVTVPSPIDTTRGYLFFVLLCFAVLCALTAWLRSARIGQRWTITRFSERAGAAAGVSVPGAKLTATAAGSAIAGLAGALMVGQYGFITADAVSPINGLVLLVVAMVAGVGRVAGAWIAGLLFVVVPWVFTHLGLPGDVATLLFGVAAIQVLATGSDGIVGQVRAMLDSRRSSGSGTGLGIDLRLLRDLGALREHSRPRSLTVSHLTVDYGAVRALDDITLELPPGSVTGLIGPNGAGKSTLVDAVSGFLPRYSGHVQLDHQQLNGMSARRRAMGGLRRTFQQSRIPPEMTVVRYLDLCARGAVSRRRLEELAGPLAGIPVGRLDISARRLVEVAGALAAAPDVVLLDEPAAGLSEADSTALGALLRDLAADCGVALLLIEHDVAMVRACCERVIVLDYGRVIASGSPEEVLRDEAVVVAYLGGEPL